MGAHKKGPRAGSLGSIPARLAQQPSFHDRRQRLNYRFLAVLVAYMSQHGTGGLRATAAECVIELVDAHGVRALVAHEGHFARTSGNSVDRVHHD
jgi:hypothetical protein